MKKVLSSFRLWWAFGLLLFLFLFSSLWLFSFQNPRIHSLEPANARLGELLTIWGENLNKDSRTHLVIGGYEPTSSSILTWLPHKIVVRVSEEMNSGLLYLQKGSRRSNVVLFMRNIDSQWSFDHRKILSSHLSSWESAEFYPYETAILYGDLLLPYDFSRQLVFYSTRTSEEPFFILPSFLITSWNQHEIRFLVPEVLRGGYVALRQGEQESNRLAFSVPSRLARWDPGETLIHRFDESVQWDVQRSRGTWFNFSFEVPQQTIWQRWFLEPEESRSLEGPRYAFYYLLGLDQTSEDSFFQSFSHEEHLEKTARSLTINPDLIVPYDKTSVLYQKYIKPSSQNWELPDHLRAVPFPQDESSAWLRVEAWYRALLLEMQAYELDDPSIQARDLSFFYVEKLRQNGIPARVIEGLYAQGKIYKEHAWGEFFLPRVGWIPSDLFLEWKEKKSFWARESASHIRFREADEEFPEVFSQNQWQRQKKNGRYLFYQSDGMPIWRSQE